MRNSIRASSDYCCHAMSPRAEIQRDAHLVVVVVVVVVVRWFVVVVVVVRLVSN